MPIMTSRPRQRAARLLLLALLLATTCALVIGALVTASPQRAATPSPSGLPACRIADEPASHAGYDQWADTLLDPRYALPSDYRPPDLEDRRIAGQRVTLRVFVFPDLHDLIASASRNGVSLRVTSGYRSYADQRKVYRDLSASPGLAARPGHSEHQLGTAVDLSGGAEWLAHNSWRYGFVLSYPPLRSPAFTCYQPESWHYRYFGRDRAAEITQSGLSPREWLWANAGQGREQAAETTSDARRPMLAIAAQPLTTPDSTRRGTPNAHGHQ